MTVDLGQVKRYERCLFFDHALFRVAKVVVKTSRPKNRIESWNTMRSNPLWRGILSFQHKFSHATFILQKYVCGCIIWMTKTQRAFSISNFCPIFKKDVRNAANFVFTYLVKQSWRNVIFLQKGRKEKGRNLATF